MQGTAPAMEVIARAKVVEPTIGFDGTTALNKAITSDYIMLDTKNTVQTLHCVDVRRDLVAIAANKSIPNLSADIYVEKKDKEITPTITEPKEEAVVETMSVKTKKKVVQKQKVDAIKKSKSAKVNVSNVKGKKKQQGKSTASTKKRSAKKRAVSKQKKKEDSTPVSISDVAVVKLTKKEIGILERIVEAEATGEDIKGKMLVANVIINRVNSRSFPDSVESVVFQKTGNTYQFSPIMDKRYWNVRVTKETKKAIQRILKGEDYSKGALYFSARKRASKSNMKWFDNHLKRLFQHGGHEFFTNK